jgi:heavy metal sensor kinase
VIGSIRFTLTLWYIGILAAILCGFGGFVYTRLEQSFDRRIDERVISQADGISGTIFAFWRAEWLEKHKITFSSSSSQRRLAMMPKTLEREIAKKRFKPLVDRWASETKVLETSVDSFRIVGTRGETILAHPNFEKLGYPPDFEKTLKEAKEGSTLYQNLEFPQERVRLVTRPVIENNQVLYLVQVATSLKSRDESLKELQFWLLLLVPGILTGTSLIGWFLATLALRPVGQMTKQAAIIEAGRLHERVKVPRTRDELERLAETFNGMLSRLENSFKRMRQFSAAASHELRTPLTVMKGELEVALKRPREAAEYQRVLETQLEVVKEMTAIVEQLLMLAHYQEQDAAVETTRVDLGELARTAAAFWQKVADTKNIGIEILEWTPVTVPGERRLLERLVSNLLDNALKHTPDGGQVKVQIMKENSAALLKVKDTGRGIAPEDLPKIFDKFFSRGDRPVAPTGGIGLGLGLCRWIAEAHQGTIEVESVVGQGTVFTVRLPVS